MDELVAEFISEASESLLDLNNELVELESNPENYDLLSKIFRVMHTIKGTCGFLSLNKLASVAHAAENILDQMRSKKLKINQQNISIILESIDSIKAIVDYIQNNGTEPSTDYTGLINKINFSISGGDIPAQIIEETPEKEEPRATGEHSESASNQTVRVKVEVLDNLMQIVSELVLNRNQLLQLDRTIRNNNLTSSLQNLSNLTTSIQEIVIGTRMQPIKNAWVKLPRIIRDISNQLNKKIKLVMIGQETELDKQLIEEIKDPLMHMVRNSADHGLEKEADRLAAGKPAEGTITLKAYHSGGHIIIEISDDGYGINIEKIKSKILEKSLATENELALLSDEQIMQYIFKPSFSTAEKITSISGRGVGMDVVKNNISNIHGSVELKSITGKGSTFTIKIPLTLAIMPILIVETCEQKFGIPQANILEMILVNENYKEQIEEINNHQILKLRDTLLPLIKLSEILQLKENNLNQDYYIIVCSVNGMSFGIIVDNIYDTEEIVLKPNSTAIKAIDIYYGITLLGSGEIIMIIDVTNVAKYISPTSIDSIKTIKEESQKVDILSNFLLVKSGDGYKAIPLELISRLEEIDVTKIETIKGKKIIQYANSLMHLELLDPNYKIPAQGKQFVIVLNNNEHILGLIAEKSVEIVQQNIEDSLSEDATSTLVLAGKITDIIDIGGFFDKLFFTSDEAPPSTNSQYKILLVEDSPYFRKLLSSLLKTEGFDISSAKNIDEALGLIKDEKNIFDLLIMDFDMPNIDGLEFAKLCKEHPSFQASAIIGLSEKNQKIKTDLISNFISKSHHGELIETIYSLLQVHDDR